MHFIRDIHARCKTEGRPALSFEFFPPKTPEGDRALFEKTMPELMKFGPDYCSVTYGAGGSTREKTLGIVDRIQRDFHLTAMAHLTCVGSTEAQLADVLDEAGRRGIKNILALRGDPPGGQGEFVKTEGGFEFSYQLVGFLRSRGGFCVGTAGFPEGHIACKEGRETDWKRLKNKIDCGADFVITQLFFDNDDFFRFRDFLGRLGNTTSIIPGIIPILSGSQIRKFTSLCGARIPDRLTRELDRLGDNDEAVADFGIEYAAEQCRGLLQAGVPGLHFYTLNKPRSTVQVVRNLGLAR
ncbi:MAG: methylenetetrahydrofolate reductase [NAD(P)H] [Verrucomicrobia bacterium]|nr:methylenetetrahydrofolate reductase [NAD(P)H] [Verrucomicrobiota bacterium]MBI3870200.1 methylenetetrahydrofolate reductase [NAD(P)H] [Verrucomicrobiota bacterium]